MIDMEQKHAGKFLYFNIFLVMALNATGYTNFSIVKLDRSIKRYQQKYKIMLACFWRLRLCMNNCIWYPSNSLECQSVIWSWQSLPPSKTKNFYWILHFITFLLIHVYSLWGFPWKQLAYDFFLEDTRKGLK